MFWTQSCLHKIWEDIKLQFWGLEETLTPSSTGWRHMETSCWDDAPRHCFPVCKKLQSWSCRVLRTVKLMTCLSLQVQYFQNWKKACSLVTALHLRWNSSKEILPLPKVGLVFCFSFIISLLHRSHLMTTSIFSNGLKYHVWRVI